MGFLQIALPGLLALSGHEDPGLPQISARLASELKGREADWTDFFFGALEHNDGLPVFHPLDYRSRLSSIAEAADHTVLRTGRRRIPTNCTGIPRAAGSTPTR